MLNYIVDFFAIIFGYVMNGLYIILDFIGLPYLWLCIILFSMATRLITIPQIIGTNRKELLSSRITYELRQLRQQYGTIHKDDKERTKQYKKDMKSVFKKFKVSSGTGCLASLLQLPIFIGMFRVVQHPFDFISQLSSLSEIEKVSVNNIFGFSLESLPQTMGAWGVLVPLAVLFGSLMQTAPKVLTKKSKPKISVIIILLVQACLVTWLSFCFPVGVSLYLVTNDITNIVIKKCVRCSLNKNQHIKDILTETEMLIQKAKEEEERIKAEAEQKAREEEERAKAIKNQEILCKEEDTSIDVIETTN